MNKFLITFFVILITTISIFFIIQSKGDMVFETYQIVDNENKPLIEERTSYENLKHQLPITLLFHIGPKKSNCRGFFSERCLVESGDNFYGIIDGFKHKTGYYYKLEVEISDVESALKYTLLQELEKIPKNKISPQDSCFYNYGLFYLNSGECGIE